MKNNSLEKIMKHIEAGGEIDDSIGFLHRIYTISKIKEGDTILYLSKFSNEEGWRVEIMNSIKINKKSEIPEVLGEKHLAKYNMVKGNVYFNKENDSKKIISNELLKLKPEIRIIYKVL